MSHTQIVDNIHERIGHTLSFNFGIIILEHFDGTASTLKPPSTAESMIEFLMVILMNRNQRARLFLKLTNPQVRNLFWEHNSRQCPSSAVGLANGDRLHVRGSCNLRHK